MSPLTVISVFKEEVAKGQEAIDLIHLVFPLPCFLSGLFDHILDEVARHVDRDAREDSLVHKTPETFLVVMIILS